MTLSLNERKAIYSQNCSKVFCNVLSISHSSLESPLRFIDNNEDIGAYSARGFDFTPPSPGADDDSATVSIDDVDRVLAETFQLLSSSEAAIAAIGLVNAEDTSAFVDGPYEYKVTSFSKNSSSGKATLSLQRLAALDANASSKRYCASTFPGLYG